MIKHEKYLNPSVTVDVVIFTIEKGELSVLLIERTKVPFKEKRALPGGFLLKNETTRTAAERILKEKAGVEKVYMEQLYTFDEPGRDPRGPIFSVTYVALVPRERLSFKRGVGIQHPTLMPIEKLSTLAFDHKKIIHYAVRRIRAKLEYTNIAFSLLPRYFTFLQLQRTYEAIVGKRIDKRNFQKKFMQLGLIRQTKKILRGGRQRPARLYEFVAHQPAELKKFF